MPTQPHLVRPGPRGAAVVHDPLPEKQFRQPVPGPHQVPADVLPGPQQIPRGLLLHTRYPDLDDLIHPQQASQMQGVPSIGLDPITRWPLQFRRRRDHTPDPRRGQLPGQAEPPSGPPRRPPRPAPATPPTTTTPPRTSGSNGAAPPSRSQCQDHTPRWTGHAHPGRHSYAQKTPGPPAKCRTDRAFAS